jgi:hypothetical protein
VWNVFSGSVWGQNQSVVNSVTNLLLGHGTSYSAEKSSASQERFCNI